QDEQALSAEAVGNPADRRRHDRGGDDVGGEHPVDLVEGRRERALHVGQRYVRNRGVERLHDGRAHGADRHHGTPAARLHCGGHWRASWMAWVRPPNSDASVRTRPVSISTLTLMPARSSERSWPGSNTIRTGTRCTTFTQLPLAFCGGRIANCAP